MKRTQIYLTERQKEVLKAKSDILGISISELIRRILDDYVGAEYEIDDTRESKLHRN